MILSLKCKEEVIMVLLESGENYLETILILQQRNGNVRSIDIATEMRDVTAESEDEEQEETQEE